MKKNPDVLVLGGGVGGLFTAAILAREGYAVTVLEKNITAGGGLQTFRRHGVTFETGMHTLGGFNKGGTLDRICRYLGIREELKLQDDDLLTEITYKQPSVTYRLPYGRQAFEDYLCQAFPHEASGIKKYVAELYSLASETDLFYLRESADHLQPHSEAFSQPADEWIASFVSDIRLRDLLAFMNPMYGGQRGVTPAYIHALLNVLYLQRPCRFKDGGDCLVEALTRVIQKSGGEVLTHQRVTHVEVSDHEVKNVETQSGCCFSAPQVVSDIHPVTLLPLLSEGALTRAYRERLTSIPETYSAFTVYVTLRGQSFPYIDHTCYFQDDFGLIWSHAERASERWPRGFMYFTPPTEQQGAWAKKLIINCVMSYQEVKPWEDSFSGHRPEAYKTWKKQMTGRVLQRMDELYSGFSQKIDYVEAATPLTIRDFYGSPEGCLFGFQKDCRNLTLSYLPVRTKVKNLWLTGQNVNLHGICGVPLTAILTAEALVGRNVVLRHIVEATK